MGRRPDVRSVQPTKLWFDPSARGGEKITVVHDAYSAGDGRGTIVGEGIYQGNTRAFAMEITLGPEPHTYLMLGLGLLAIGTYACGGCRHTRGRCRLS